MGPADLSPVDRQQITDLIVDYCTAVDDQDPDAVAALFTDNCTVSFAAGPDGTVHGRDALRRRVTSVLRGFDATSHHVSNVRLRARSPDIVEGATYLMAWHRFPGDRPDGYLWGRYHDVFARGTTGWLVTERTLRIAGATGFPAPWHPALPAGSAQSASHPPSTTT